MELEIKEVEHQILTDIESKFSEIAGILTNHGKILNALKDKFELEIDGHKPPKK